MNTPNTVYIGPFINYEWRGFNYFAQLEEAQADAGIELTLDVCRRHDKAGVLLPLDDVRFPAILSGRDDHLSL